MGSGEGTRRQGLRGLWLLCGSVCLACLAATTPLSPSHAVSERGDSVSLIVQFAPGVKVREGGRVPGAAGIASPLRNHMRVALGLGEQMYRVDFTKPVTAIQVKRVSRQLRKLPQIVFVQRDQINAVPMLRAVA